MLFSLLEWPQTLALPDSQYHQTQGTGNPYIFSCKGHKKWKEKGLVETSLQAVVPSALLLNGAGSSGWDLSLYLIHFLDNYNATSSTKPSFTTAALFMSHPSDLLQTWAALMHSSPSTNPSPSTTLEAPQEQNPGSHPSVPTYSSCTQNHRITKS